MAKHFTPLTTLKDYYLKMRASERSVHTGMTAELALNLIGHLQELQQEIEALRGAGTIPPNPNSDDTLQARADFHRDNWRALFPDALEETTRSFATRVGYWDNNRRTFTPVVFTPYGYVDDPEGWG